MPTDYEGYFKVVVRALPDRDSKVVTVIRYVKDGDEWVSELFTSEGWYRFERFDILPLHKVPEFPGSFHQVVEPL